jgi:ABC-type nickel/cobalt efflux system permease component RcnA
MALAVVAAVLVPAVVSAHPLGNFTINHYAGLFIEPERVLLDVVIDQAEIPAFTARQAIDADSDGEVTDEELDVGRVAACQALVPDLSLTLDGTAAPLELVEAGIDFPPGVGGLQTMRTVCGFVADLPTPLVNGEPASRLAFADASFPARLGWREIVVVGSGVAVAPLPGAGEVRPESLTERLTSYPEDLIAQPLDDGALEVEVAASSDVAVVERPSIDDAAPVPGAPVVPPPPAAPGSTATPGASGSPTPAVPAVPGGVGGGDVPSIFREAALTPVVLLLSVMTAVALGAGHALTPGHGKTLMAAYLVGTRGRPLHAVGLGLSVSVSHTAGILVLAALVVGAADVLPADVVVRAAPIVASVSILAIGAWMLAGEWRRRRSAVAQGSPQDHGHAHAHPDAEPHGHGHSSGGPHEPHGHGHSSDGLHEHEGHEHLDDPPHAHPHPHPHPVDQDHGPGEHSHGGIRHSHLPPTGTTITWRSLFILGLAGGLIPSTSALLILLGSIAAGRTAFGLVLVVAFGLGMAAVMTSIGLVLVFARERLEGMPASPTVRRIRDAVPLVAAVLVFGFGIYLTVQALSGAPTL